MNIQLQYKIISTYIDFDMKINSHCHSSFKANRAGSKSTLLIDDEPSPATLSDTFCDR